MSALVSTEDKDWKALQELRVIEDGSATRTVGVKNPTYPREVVDRFNIDNLLVQNKKLNQSQIESSLDPLSEEYAFVESMQRGVEDVGSLSDLRKAIGELALLQSLTSALRENTSYALKDTYGQEYDSAALSLPLTQEIDVMQRLNKSAHRSLSTRLEAAREIITRRHRFETDLIKCKERWPILVVNRNTRQIAERPEVVTFQQDRDILCIDCFWRSRPQLFHNPLYFTYLEMNKSTGQLELDSVLNSGVAGSTVTEKSVLCTLQLSIKSTTSNNILASKDLWSLLRLGASNDNFQSIESNLYGIFKHSLLLKHTSLVREVFAKLVEEVHKFTTVVASVNSNANGRHRDAMDVVDSDSVIDVNASFSEQFSLCDHSEKSLSWQISAHLTLTIQLISIPMESMDPEVSSSFKDKPHWDNLVDSTFVALMGTFYVTLEAQISDEIDRQWRQRSGESERQVVSRRTQAPNGSDLTTAASKLQPQSILVETFHTLRIQHQKQRLVSCLNKQLSNLLMSAGLILAPFSSRDCSKLPENVPPFEQQAKSQGWLFWWHQHIAPLVSIHLEVSIGIHIPSVFYPSSVGNRSAEALPLLSLTIMSPVVAADFAPASWIKVEKDFIEVESSYCATKTHDILTVSDFSTLIIHHVLAISLRWYILRLFCAF
jgi:hypothetical protein